MFNLIVRSMDWHSGVGTMPLERMFEYTDKTLEQAHRQDGDPLLAKLENFPCLFMHEGTDDQLAYVGRIYRARINNHEVSFQFTLDADVPALPNSAIFAQRTLLDITNDFEFHRNHWALKEVDLYRFLLRSVRPRRQRPNVFEIPEHENIEEILVSVMMPFSPAFNSVYESIQAAAAGVGLRCRRADDIWENPAVIQDVVSLIDRSRIVVCDCTARNPNVFYEAGIAHTLGREVILITQSEQDIPFDLRHLRYVRYLDNGEGRTALTAALQMRMKNIVGT